MHLTEVTQTEALRKCSVLSEPIPSLKCSSLRPLVWIIGVKKKLKQRRLSLLWAANGLVRKDNIKIVECDSLAISLFLLPVCCCPSDTVLCYVLIPRDKSVFVLLVNPLIFNHKQQNVVNTPLQ